MSTKVYRGWRDKEGTPHVTVNRRPLRHIAYHSNGFDWGEPSDRAADLALSLLANHLGERLNPRSRRFLSGEYTSWRLHQDFAAEIVTAFSRTEQWQLTSDQITTWLERRQP